MENSLEVPPLTTTRTPLIGSIRAQTRSYIAFVLLGVATLLPFNFYIAANSYFSCKFNDSSGADNSSVHVGYIYESTVILCGSFTNLITLILVTMKCAPYVLKYRIYISFIIIIICLLLSIGPALATNIAHTYIFFGLTMVLVMIQTVCSAVLLNCFYSLASTLPNRYIQGFGTGHSIGGIFISISLIISLTSADNLHEAIPIFFGCAIVVIIASIIVYYFLEKSHLFQIYSSATQEINNDQEAFVRDASSDQESYTWSVATTTITQRSLMIYRKIQWNFWGIFLTFLVTFSVFPAALSKIQPTHWQRFQEIFSPVMTFLLFFVGETLGRVLTSKIHLPSIQSPRSLFSICVLRFLFILLFAFCNFPATADYLIHFKEDYIYGILVLFFGASHGYCNSLNLMYAPQHVRVEHTGSVGALMLMAVGAGTFVGSIMSYVILYAYGLYKPEFSSCPKQLS